jgi:hypothetical protein
MSRRLTLAIWMGLAAAVRAAAGPVVFLPFGGLGGPGGDTTLHPGQVVEVRWTGTPWGVEEMELLLSVDGGRHFAVRITPDLDADLRSYWWRVPPLQSGNAHLAIRVNLDGREVLAGVGERFRIAADLAADKAAAGPLYRWPMHAHGGELWITDAESGVADPNGKFELTPVAAGRSVASGWPPIMAAVPPSPRPAPSPSTPVPAGQTDRGTAPLPLARADCRRPPIVPLRI